MGPGQSPGLPPGEGRGQAAPGSAQDAGRCPSTHRRLERLRGGKAQLRTAFLSRSRATRLRCRSGCSRCRGCPLDGFTKGGEGPEVNAATARERGGANEPTAWQSRLPVLTSEWPVRTPRSFTPRFLLSSEQRACRRDPYACLYPMGCRRGVRAYDPLTPPTSSPSRRGNRESEVERWCLPRLFQVSQWFL